MEMVALWHTEFPRVHCSKHITLRQPDWEQTTNMSAGAGGWGFPLGLLHWNVFAFTFLHCCLYTVAFYRLKPPTEIRPVDPDGVSACLSSPGSRSYRHLQVRWTQSVCTQQRIGLGAESTVSLLIPLSKRCSCVWMKTNLVTKHLPAVLWDFLSAQGCSMSQLSQCLRCNNEACYVMLCKQPQCSVHSATYT